MNINEFKFANNQVLTYVQMNILIAAASVDLKLTVKLF